MKLSTFALPSLALPNLALLGLVLLALSAGTASAQRAIAPGLEHAPKVTQYARTFLAGFVDDAMLHSVVRESTKSHRKLGWDEARALDRRWRDERADGKRDGLVDAIAANALSAWLKQQMAGAANGAVTEIHVIDGLGWNVGETRESADFFQGDELQWQEILPNTADAVIVSELEDNGGNGRTLALVSLPIADGDVNIGVVTLGVDVSKLP
jgi:hypothetical protein